MKEIWLPALVAYLIGALPFSLLIGLMFGKDIRQAGSGNIGATNVWRICGPVAGTLAYVLDIAKGSAAVLVALKFFPIEKPPVFFLHFVYVLILFLPILGHLFPLYLKFKGGKGVATSAGVLLVITPWALITTMGIFLLVFWRKHFISLASLYAAMAYPLMLSLFYASRENFSSALEWVQHGSFYQILSLAILLTIAIFMKHRSNIARLLRGQEFGLEKKKNP